MTSKSNSNTNRKGGKEKPPVTTRDILISQSEVITHYNHISGQVSMGNDLRWADLQRFPELAFRTRANFLADHAGHYVLNDAGEWVDAASWWLKQKDRRRYAEVIFDPALFFKNDGDPRHSTERSGETVWRLNLFTGFAVKPNKFGSCDLFYEHLRENYCGGDPATLKTVLDWMAHVVQRPGKPIGWALAVVGDMGCGKSVVSDVLAEIVGKRYSPVFSTPESLLGKFNAPLAKCLLGRVEEAFNPRDPRHIATLKKLLEGGEFMLENKGIDPIMVDNHANFIFTSNNEHFLTAGTQGERRYFAFKCGDGRQQDGAFFSALKRQMKAGGYAKLLHDLLERDISGVDFTSPPMTAVLSTQIRASLGGLERWWADCLEAGELVFAQAPERCEPLGWDEWDDAEADAVTAQAKVGVSYTARPFQPLKSVVMASAASYARDYSGRPPSPGVVGKFLAEQGALGVRTKEGGERVQRFRFPALEACRATFAQARTGLRLEDIGGVTTPDNVVQMTTAQAA